MWAIIKKELKSTFLSPIGYIIIAMFLVVYSTFFYITAIATGTVDLSQTYYTTAIYGLPFIVAILTMKSFAEERSKGTEDLLLMSSKSIFSIVAGKIIATLAVIVITLIMSFLYYFILSRFGNPNLTTVLVTMFGFLLLSLAYISFGIMVSSCTENTIVSAIITFVALLVPLFLPQLPEGINNLILPNLFYNFVAGIISIKSICGILSFAIMCYLITVVVMKRRRNRR